MDEIPEGLDDLLNSIRGGGSSALAIRTKSKKKSEDNIVDERIDERILRLLGLEDVTDIDYSTYKTLLRERVAAARMGGSSIPTEEVELVTEEFKRVKSKTGRFKVKKSAIKKDAFFGAATAAKTRAPKRREVVKALPAAIDSEGEKSEEQDQFIRSVLAPSLATIEKNLEGILDTLTKQYQLDKKESEVENKEKEKAKKAGREAKLEGRGETNKIKSIAEKITKPAQGIFDFIKNFIINTLMGGAFSWLLEFLQDPAGVWDRTWKNVVGAIIGVLNDVLKTVFDFILQPFNALIDQLNGALRSIETNINKALALFGQKGITLPTIDPISAPQIPTDWLKPAQPPQGGKNVPGMVGGGLIDKKTGSLISGMGKDTQLVALSPGEVVMSNKAGDMYGRDNLLAMNSAAGGTNKPKKGKVMGFEGGGQVGKIVIGAGHAPSEENAMKGVALGSDGRPVQGTQDYKTGVAEWEATRHLVKTLKQIVDNNNLSDRVSFQNIVSYAGLRGVPSSVEKTSGTQFVDLHFDARGGRGGVLRPYSNQVSSVDRAMAAVFGNYPGIKPGEKGVTAAGGTILEVAAIDDPAIGQFLGEVKKGRIGKHSMALANKVLNSMMPGLSGSVASTQPAPVKKLPAPSVPPAPVSPAGSTVKVVYSTTGPQKGSAATAGSSANQKRIPAFSAIDANNFEMLVIKSIYNIAG